MQHHRPPRAAMVSPSKQHPPHWRHSSSAGHLGQLGHLPPSGGGSAGHLTTTHHRRPSFQLHAAVDDGERFTALPQCTLRCWLSSCRLLCPSHLAHFVYKQTNTFVHSCVHSFIPLSAEVGAKLSSLEEWGKKEAARCDSGDPDLEFCELPGIINTPPAERPAAEEAWSRGRCVGVARGRMGPVVTHNSLRQRYREAPACSTASACRQLVSGMLVQRVWHHPAGMHSSITNVASFPASFLQVAAGPAGAAVNVLVCAGQACGAGGTGWGQAVRTEREEAREAAAPARKSVFQRGGRYAAHGHVPPPCPPCLPAATRSFSRSTWWSRSSSQCW